MTEDTSSGKEEIEEILISQKGEHPISELDFLTALSRTSFEEIAKLERTDILGMRRQWSFVLLFLIAAVVLYDLWFTTAIGKGWLLFTNDNLVIYFILENLAKIGGLAYIVVNFLFDRNQRS